MEDRRTKIVATIGPASYDESILTKMIQAGMNVARLNFSHGTYEEHEAAFKKIRRISGKLGKPVAIMQDLQGVKIRTGQMQEPVTILPNEDVTLTTSDKPGEGQIPVDYSELHQHVEPDSTILLDDGSMELRVESVQGNEINCQVVVGGMLKPNKGINLPGSRVDIPGFTKKDAEDLAFGLKLGVDAVAVSFVAKAEDIARVRKAVTENTNQDHPIIIAKLERPQALENLDEIIDAADGVMIARGDLGVEMRPETVPIAQKQIIEKANQHKKIVITATQMLESMIHNPRPTRAEATDVANAIFDGTDAVMLSGETAIGSYPVKTIEMMVRIICKSEENLKQWGRWRGTSSDDYYDDAIAMTGAARELAHDLNVAAVVVFTQSGRTARFMSKARPRVPVIAFTPDHTTLMKIAFYWGVHPNMLKRVNSIEEMLESVDSAMVASTPIKAGQQVVVISGFPVGSSRLPNLALLHTIGNNKS